MNLPPMEPAKLQITSEQMDSICCDACGHEYFKQVLILKRISKLYTGTTKDKVVIDRLINTHIWDVEDASKWVAEDSNRYNYDIKTTESKKEK